jgi:hypothetical protein
MEVRGVLAREPEGVEKSIEQGEVGDDGIASPSKR